MRVGRRAFANPVNQKNGHRCDDEQRGEIERDGVAEEVWQRQWTNNTASFAAFGEILVAAVVGSVTSQSGNFTRRDSAVEKLDKIIRPAFRDRHVADRIFENQIPADDPGDDLAESRVGISVGGTGNRNHGGELAVTKRREPAGERRDDEGDRDRRPRRGSSEHEVAVSAKRR